MRRASFGLVLVQMIILTIPLEISKTWFPVLLLEKPVDGNPVSLIDISRLALLALVIVLLIDVVVRHHKLSRLGMKRLKLPLILLGIYCISWSYSPAPLTVRNEVSRLLLHILVVLAMIHFIRKFEQVFQLLRIFQWTTLILSVMVVIQATTGIFFWNASLAVEHRYNATMADPNILARYLVIGFFVWLLGPAGRLRLPGIIVCLLAVVLIGSRGAWLTFAIMSGALVFVAPRLLRIRVIVMLVMSMSMTAFALIISSSLRNRFATLLDLVGSAGARIDYIRAGVAMFIDHPFLGVGLGGYPISYVTDYRQYLSYYGEAGNQSHTALVTITAEMGIVGLIITLLFALQTYVVFMRVKKRGNPAAQRAALICFIAIGTIFLGSQTETRFWEDPYLWVFWGLLIVSELIQQKANHAQSIISTDQVCSCRQIKPCHTTFQLVGY